MVPLVPTARSVSGWSAVVPRLSVTRAVKSNAPYSVGAPVKVPLAFNTMPAGSVPTAVQV